MEQVFQLMNVLLGKDRETGKRNLHIRTYKVVPLAAQAGVLEYVVNTERLNEWLPAAHTR
jgi:ataxia telangiectasia mutated family protein